MQAIKFFADIADEDADNTTTNSASNHIVKNHATTNASLFSEDIGTDNSADDFVLAYDTPEAKRKTNIASEELEHFYNLIREQRKIFFSGKGLAKKVRDLVDTINYRDFLLVEFAKNEKAVRFKLKNIETFVQSIDTWENNPDNTEPNLFNYLNRITLLSRDDLDDDGDKGKVNLMTIHAAKGLEFPVVFIAGAEEGIMPHARSVEENDGDVEEERRLFYVAITRARKKLFISACKKRRRQQSDVECAPSRFLDEIPADLVKYHEPSKELSQEKVTSSLSGLLANLAARGKGNGENTD